MERAAHRLGRIDASTASRRRHRGQCRPSPPRGRHARGWGWTADGVVTSAAVRIAAAVGDVGSLCATREAATAAEDLAVGDTGAVGEGVSTASWSGQSPRPGMVSREDGVAGDRSIGEHGDDNGALEDPGRHSQEQRPRGGPREPAGAPASGGSRELLAWLPQAARRAPGEVAECAAGPKQRASPARGSQPAAGCARHQQPRSRRHANVTSGCVAENHCPRTPPRSRGSRGNGGDGDRSYDIINSKTRI